MVAPCAPNEKCYKLTTRANDLFERHLYAEALIEYTKALKCATETGSCDDDYLALIYANRSATCLQVGDCQQAKEDAARAIALAKRWGKGYFRYGQVLLKLSQYDKAIEYFKSASNLEPKSSKDISLHITKALIEKDNEAMGIKILQLVAGKDFAIEKNVLNPIQTKLYEFALHMKNIIHVVVDIATKQCVLVDACWDIDGILKFVQDQGYTVVSTIVTHYHFDHVGGSPPAPYDTLPIKISGLAHLLKKLPHIKAYMHPLDIPYLHGTIQLNRLVPTCTTSITSELTIGQVRLQFLHTPGHTPGSQSILVNQSRLIAGDTLLGCGHCGRTDLPGGDRKAMEHTLRYVLGGLDDRIVVYPGHDYGTTWSTIAIEKENGCLDTTDENVEIWKMKKLIKSLQMARGNGTSMISLVIPPKDQISRVVKMLADEYGTASNIKSRVNRLSVLSAITSTQQRLKLYTRVPENGLVVYCGTIITDEGKEKKVNIDFEPHKPINTSLYLCDNKFHVEALSELLDNDAKFGFIVMDGNGSLFGTVCGNVRDVIHKLSVDLPKKHGRGGQSALRFSRLREEKRHNYVRKIAELAVQLFITNDKVNVVGLVLAGSADFKTELSQSDLFDPRLRAKVVKIVDVSYGGENGFNQAIELSAEALSNVKFIQEKRLIGDYFGEISQDTGKYCFGVEDTLKALEMGAVETLIVWENLTANRYILRDASGTEVVVYPNAEEEKQKSFMVDTSADATTNSEMEVIECMPLLEWFTHKYKEFGANLEIITDRSQEGAQFVRGFGGIGGILRYRVNFEQLNYESDEFISDDDEEYI
ncbi:hypothetical protein G6F37_006804 [Rhizopus arrhizus]|nr:hypothetical protein G6F38_005819 [Rhizopus arrhizus]KAG1157325.1 hypothetical protein G6F37_006804 [Rhizopus arrhizus]